ncbi:hypothetical protein HanXRQr2_Chr04g0167641 [Helianthus annuus]|uniref:Uncharacterized protein n=2 Tax=Helianthus annuus TaxID=4232 RepID=A0A9K3J7Q2_HELAN|nr:hypothetical protein HanXRQr2_Chr04g0167641 [Helianthus annuus]KAJ0581150.1 hypothetical protein HanHA300_Chr04g0137661 [Helianthus annuus]KAJ0597094.1 hypothetical protein HanHA89_Chr04g0150591 [Helianthus annuus]KAJ0757772.1 hypothetical protein HanLR1_Chr04g0142661 [Helianthus annuus]KAJ0761448.1 hypothetical protein HanOQP8_Chr04g0149981 [Helianthus annuus]
MFWKKVLGLDDLLVDHYKEKNRVAERESKLAKTKRSYNSDDEEDGRVAKLSKYVDECHEKMTQLGDEDDVSHWGLQVFGKQKTPQSFAFSELSSCSLFRLCVDHEVNSLVELSTESGETFFEGLLTNGWLLKLVSKCGEVEKSIANWTFHLMLYSSKEVLRNVAVDFWCAILLLKNEDESPSIKIDWLPSYSELSGALETFGFVFHSPTKDSSDTEIYLEILKAVRHLKTLELGLNTNIHCTFTTSEAEELVVVIICLLLDRQLLGLSVELNEYMLALVNFFTDDEWRSNCVQVTKSVASRMNSLRAVEFISVVHGPTKLLRSEIAFRILLGCFDKIVNNPTCFSTKPLPLRSVHRWIPLLLTSFLLFLQLSSSPSKPVVLLELFETRIHEGAIRAIFKRDRQ